MSDISGKDSAKAWKALVRNLWFRRIAWIALVVVLIAVAAIVGKEVYKWDQNRTIWMNADEMEFGAYRLKDGRVFLEVVGRDHYISVIEDAVSEEGIKDCRFRMGYTKAGQNIKTDHPENCFVISKDYENVVLEGTGKNASTVICSMEDELPPATEEMEQKAAQYDEWMSGSFFMSGRFTFLLHCAIIISGSRSMEGDE